MDPTTGSKEFGDDRETPRDSEESSSDTEYSPRSPAEAAKKACKRTFSPNAGKEKPVRSKLKKQCPKLPMGSVRVPSFCHSCRSARMLQERKHFAQCSRCASAFCDTCLTRRHGEDAHEESGPGLQWVCPRCRGGCGPGCEKHCCVCSKCCRSKGEPREMSAARSLIKKSQSAGFDGLHDYLIHLKTRESKEEIQNRKSWRRWTKAGGSGTSPSNIDKNVNYHRSLIEQKGQEKKGRNAGDREPHRGRLNESTVASICTKGTKTKKACPKQVQRQSQEKDFTSRSDELGHHRLKKPRQTLTYEIDRSTTDDQEIDQGKINQGDKPGLSRSNGSEEKVFKSEYRKNSFKGKKRRNTGAESDSGRVKASAASIQPENTNQGHQNKKRRADEELKNKSKALMDSLVPFGDMGVIVYLMGRWLSKEKHFAGKRLSIILTDKEVKLRNAIKARSYSKEIAKQFHPAGRLMSRPPYEQEDMKNRLKDRTVRNKLTESKMHLQQVYQEIDLMITDGLPTAKKDVDLAIQCLIEDMERAEVDAIERELASLDGSSVPHEAVVESLVNLWDRGTGIAIEERPIVCHDTFKALIAAVDVFGGLAVSIYLLRQWFSRDKGSSGNQIWINLTDEEVELQNFFKRNLYQVFLLRHISGRTREDWEHKIVHSRNQKIDALITECSEIKKNADLGLESITKAVHQAVDAIVCMRKTKSC